MKSRRLYAERVFRMSKFLVENTNGLSGKVLVQGSKNSALPILAATILCNSECVIKNCPDLSDVDATIEILQSLGAKVKKEKNNIIIDPSTINNYIISRNLMTKMRSSILFLGAIISRMGKVKLHFPGGCQLGPRPIDWHLKALAEMGLFIECAEDLLSCKANGKLNGTNIKLPLPSVGATENIILAAVFAKGTTIIENAAREPEISDLCEFLNKCGAKIVGAGSSKIEIIGVDRLHGTEHTVIPDRIVAATFMAATAITGGNILLKNVIPEHLESITTVLQKSGCDIIYGNSSLVFICRSKVKSIGTIVTKPYPGFPTDAQALIMAMCTLAQGNSVFIETIFEHRYKHVPELLKLGADIKLMGQKAYVNGVEKLYGNHVKAADLRGAAALIIAALAAQGQTIIEGCEFLDRGYESFESKLRSIGANIKRI